MSSLGNGFAAGYGCLAAWADLLDRINVFPVADGDTGTNLRISLAPLRKPDDNIDTTCNLLARCATGNSGNIAAAFFREFCRAKNFTELAEKAALGRERAWQAIADPRAGTMLSVFDSLAAALQSMADEQGLYHPLHLALQRSVLDTTQMLPDLREAGVVDSGALAMYVFFDGCFRHLAGVKEQADSLFDTFAGRLAISTSFRQKFSDSYCVDAVIQLGNEPGHGGNLGQKQATLKENLAKLGESLVVVEDETFLKIHIHTPDPRQLRGQLGSLGDIVQWSDAAIAQTSFAARPDAGKKPVLHIVTDAAGSLTRAMAEQLDITLLDSYIIIGDDSRPESLYTSDQIYPLMRQGRKITTAQTSTFERHQHYRSICQQFGPSLYLSVGAAFTGNYHAAMAWKADDDLGRLLTVIDTGAASGRLALIAILTARHARNCDRPEEILVVAQNLVTECREYVFIHELKYLVAGGRVSKAGGFFGDLLHMKPVISPTLAGVKKVGVVRSSKGQVAFALARLAEHCLRGTVPLILLQYSDNERWVAGTVRQQVSALLPQAEILLTPLSLTSGVHMGPGTWSMAFATPPALSSDGQAR